MASIVAGKPEMHLICRDSCKEDIPSQDSDGKYKQAKLFFAHMLTFDCDFPIQSPFEQKAGKMKKCQITGGSLQAG